MIEKFKDFMVQSGATWVLWSLIALSVAALAVVIERALAFRSRRDDVVRLARELRTLLASGDLLRARRRLAESRSSEAAVVLAGLEQWPNGVARAREAMAAASGLERAYLERRLVFLGTVGSNAPFVGLLGTVIGIVGAFDELGRTALLGATGAGLAPERVMSTIAEALVATAVGLIVAIPAVVTFNYFQARLGVMLGNAETLGHLLLAAVEH